MNTIVEVFKTDVSEPGEAKLLVDALRAQFPGSRPSFDLEDCDKVLRIAGVSLCCTTIISIINQFGYNCHVLD